MDRDVAVSMLLALVPGLRAEGWVITPYNVLVDDRGTVVVIVRESEDLGRRLRDQIRELQPRLQVQFQIRPQGRHVVFRL